MLKTLRKALDEDRTKTFVVEISPLGLVEMTRQNVTDGVREIMTRPCPTCDGEGVIKSEETIAIEFERRHARPRQGDRRRGHPLQMNPRVSAEFTGDEARALHADGGGDRQVVHFEGSEGLPLDHFAVVLEGSREQVLERALPFREGEEVHVEIVEPHMYSPGDAVAKIDGYIDLDHRRRRLRGREAPGADRGGGPHRRGGHAGRRCLDVSRGRRLTGRSTRWPRIEASASWPQRRTAPFGAKAGAR